MKPIIEAGGSLRVELHPAASRLSIEQSCWQQVASELQNNLSNSASERLRQHRSTGEMRARTMPRLVLTFSAPSQDRALLLTSPAISCILRTNMPPITGDRIV